MLSVDGMVIRRARTYILKCEACYKTTTDLMKQFCGSCGNHTLYKVAALLAHDLSLSGLPFMPEPADPNRILAWLIMLLTQFKLVTRAHT